MPSRTARKVTSAKVADQYATHVLPTYGTAPFTLVRGEGSYVWDAENRRYLDFTSGIAVNTLGHCHPEWTRRMTEQMAELVHVSNLFHVPGQGRLAQRLAEKAGPGKAFFCNSGAEANEFLIKLSRLWGRRRNAGEGGRHVVLTAENSFHGRTFGGLSATPQAKVQTGFAPLLEGFRHAPFNDLEAFRKAATEDVAAIMVETIQGEGGIYPATTEFLKGLRALCDERKILLMIDEVQCGIGRTGRFFAYEEAGIVPDAIAMAKGLGGGYPIGAAWVREPFTDLFQPGSHGTTFGGSPLACAAANAVLDIMEQENLLDRVAVQSGPFHEALDGLVRKHSDKVKERRGRGYHVALAVHGDPLALAARLRENGLLVVRGGDDAIRLMPPLTAGPQDLDTAVEIIDFVLGTEPST
ncbi:MAG: acetylornithine/succinylornithine family transaminase [Verrucomicrobia bacterium]|jgi:acetylornithine aminotransferase/acetylornithine/N-succinyldiaminopimelate aminotransferase|nr:acetylornithine/succinylornithine family transaminase [Verrucomicrobiota bacterium]